jgi:hypothetical protein
LNQVSWYRREPVTEASVPVLGADLIDLRRLPEIRARAVDSGAVVESTGEAAPAAAGLLSDPELAERVRVWRERAAQKQS